ncbi:hypothetical protein L3Q82_000714 [Scortum barcoo]|uniref:Uncharacterized protein n=1 Tax=Scortum barcoo TaxID=214431 RepID=A0ACB8WEX3_9TELE|nr:hypothetical protein L3Q82_000714 [Scortum barcoo]
MFGRTPRLPVDLLFGSVLLDDQVVDYDTYVQSLRRDLAEAMRVAQVSCQGNRDRLTFTTAGLEVSTSPEIPAVDIVDEAVDDQDRTVSCDLPAGVECSSNLIDTQPVAPVPLHDSRTVEEGTVVRSGLEGLLINAALGNTPDGYAEPTGDTGEP